MVDNSKPLNEAEHGNKAGWFPKMAGWPETTNEAYQKYVFAAKTGELPDGTFMIDRPGKILRVQTTELLAQLEKAYEAFKEANT